jgi:DNA polymerase III sliding clamp (beta) subunit (PCNA family)
VSANPTRPEFNGINFVIESDCLNLYSSDGKSISRFTLKDKFSVEPTEQIQVIIPAFFCEKLTVLHPALVGKNANVECQFDKQWVTANLDKNFLFTRVIDRKPPDCEGTILQYVPNLDSRELWDIPSEFESILNRAVLFLDAANGINESEFTVTGDEIRVHTTSKIGTSTDTFQIPVILENFSFSVDPNLLLRAFKLCKKMTFKPNVVILQNEEFLHLIATKVN